MSKINDGGSAFPRAEPHCQGYGHGMSLRDWFAGLIAAGMTAHSGTAGPYYGAREIADRAFEVADAMLSTRSNRGEEDNG